MWSIARHPAPPVQVIVAGKYRMSAPSGGIRGVSSDPPPAVRPATAALRSTIPMLVLLVASRVHREP